MFNNLIHDFFLNRTSIFLYRVDHMNLEYRVLVYYKLEYSNKLFNENLHLNSLQCEYNIN